MMFGERDQLRHPFGVAGCCIDQGYTGERAAKAAAGHGIVLKVVKLPEAKRASV